MAEGGRLELPRVLTPAAFKAVSSSSRIPSIYDYFTTLFFDLHAHIDIVFIDQPMAPGIVPSFP